MPVPRQLSIFRVYDEWYLNVKYGANVLNFVSVSPILLQDNYEDNVARQVQDCDQTVDRIQEALRRGIKFCFALWVSLDRQAQTTLEKGLESKENEHKSGFAIDPL